MSRPITVSIADDHVPTRAGVRAALERDGFCVVAESGNAAAAVADALAHRPDVCLLDVNMPGGGIGATAKIHDALPDTAILMLTVSEDDEDLFRSLRGGAAGYLLKDIDPDRLGAAIRGVLAGEAAIPRKLVARMVEELRHSTARRFPILRGRGVDLTEREQQVLQMLRDSRSTKEISAALDVSPVTVRRHVSEILRKLGVPDRAAAVRLLEDAERAGSG